MELLSFHISEDFPRLIEERFDAQSIRGNRVAEKFKQYEEENSAREFFFGNVILRYLNYLSKKEGEKLSGREDIFWAELLGRYLRLVLREVFDSEEKIPIVNIRKYWNGLRRNECIKAETFTATLRDLTGARIFFAQQNVKERVEGETLWELYGEYLEATGNSFVRLSFFYLILPSTWRIAYPYHGENPNKIGT